METSLVLHLALGDLNEDTDCAGRSFLFCTIAEPFDNWKEEERDASCGIPFRFPGFGRSASSEWLLIDVFGRDFEPVFVGRVIVDWLNAIDVCGRPR